MDCLLLTRLGTVTPLVAAVPMGGTSFNLHEEPTVCSSQDAIRTFLQSGQEAFGMEDFLLTKND